MEITTPPSEQSRYAGATVSDISIDLLDLSLDEISDRAEATTKVLNEILDREKSSRNYRDWGINE